MLCRTAALAKATTTSRSSNQSFSKLEYDGKRMYRQLLHVYRLTSNVPASAGCQSPAEAAAQCEEGCGRWRKEVSFLYPYYQSKLMPTV
jgi:hypothetical protein